MVKIWIISDMTDSCQEEGVRDWELVFGLVLVFCVFFDAPLQVGLG